MRAERSARVFQPRNKNQTHENSNNSSILTTIMRNFSPVWNISSFKRSFHCIMRTDRSARVFQRRNKPRHTKIAIIHRFWRQLFVISLPFEIFRSLNAIFTALCVQKGVHDYFATSEQAHTHANRNRSSIVTIIMRYFSPVWVISTFQRTSHCMQNAEHAFSIVETSPDTRK